MIYILIFGEIINFPSLSYSEKKTTTAHTGHCVETCENILSNRWSKKKNKLF